MRLVDSATCYKRLLTAVYLLICNYFKNISKKVCVCKNKSYLYAIIINK